MSKKNINDYTMEELWGPSVVSSDVESEIAVTRVTRQERPFEKLMYCLKLNNGGYVVECNDNEIMEVPSKEFADAFNSIAEAEKFRREHWIDARVIPWSQPKVLRKECETVEAW